jgi:kanamycin kinase
MIAGRPDDEVPVPRAVAALAAGRTLAPVWENELGGLTFEMGDGPARRFVKWAPAGSALDLAAESARLAWAVAYTPVPRVVDAGTDDQGSWIVTLPVPGENAVTERWRSEPATAVRAIGAGLRALHDTLPVAACPFSWHAADRVAVAHARADARQIDPARWNPDHHGITIRDALRRVDDIPKGTRTVVCHGDACAPNTLLTADGSWSGHVDLGALGVGDQWADLAVATWSCEWNYGPGWQSTLLDAYGITPDPARTAYYRLLWDLGP